MSAFAGVTLSEEPINRRAPATSRNLSVALFANTFPLPPVSDFRLRARFFSVPAGINSWLDMDTTMEVRDWFVSIPIDSRFTANGQYVFQFTGSSNRGASWGDTVVRVINVHDAPPLEPSNLAPRTQQNRTEPIILTWQNNPFLATDTQTDSQAEFWQGSGARRTISGGANNTATIPANTFPTEGAVNFRARTRVAQSELWGAWSEEVSFPLITINPPLPPTNLQPSSSQNPTRQIRLEWTHQPATDGMADWQDGSEVRVRQGNGAWQTFAGDFGNRFTLLADTFTAGGGNVQFQARTHGSRGGWGAWSAVATFPLVLEPPLAPTNLAPTDTQNRRTNINLSWRHTPNPADWDTQLDSEVEIWQDAASRRVIHAGNINRLELPADTFADNRTVHFRVRTSTTRNGWGVWSAITQFTLDSFAPRAPENLAPTDTRNPRLDITLTWWHIPNERWFPNDGQTDSETEVWQGSSTPQTFRGYAENRAIVPALTFNANAPLTFRARTCSNLGGWGAWSATVEMPLAISPALAPQNVQILTEFTNPRGAIRISWMHTPNPEMPTDEQVNSEIRVRQGTANWLYFSGGVENYAHIPAFTFATTHPLEFQARTVTAINGVGEWSAVERIDLMDTPPLPPVLTHPVNIAVRATDGVFLQWSYNSPYDIFPSRFDVRYRIGGGNWEEIRIDSHGGIPAATNATTRAEINQSRLDWQVRAWSELHEAGEWSDITQAFIIGIPPTPVLVQVTNSGRPQIHFSARGAMAWEIEILKNGAIVYTTGERAFVGSFIHIAERFFDNGEYEARLRIANEYGLYSEWTALSFEISISPPTAIKLCSANNLNYRTRLWFSGAGRTGYVYRSQFENDNFIRIARVYDVETFEDWTVQPGQRYKYFIRTVSDNFGFSDSNLETAKADFKETVIAKTDTPHDMVKLLWQLGGMPTKNSEVQQDKTITNFAGREKPVLQIGVHHKRRAILAFYVSHTDRDKLEALAKSESVLILRDWRLGVLYGTITDGIVATADGFSDHVQVQFTFTETDYSEEVEII